MCIICGNDVTLSEHNQKINLLKGAITEANQQKRTLADKLCNIELENERLTQLVDEMEEREYSEKEGSFHPTEYVNRCHTVYEVLYAHVNSKIDENEGFSARNLAAKEVVERFNRKMKDYNSYVQLYLTGNTGKNIPHYIQMEMVDNSRGENLKHTFSALLKMAATVSEDYSVRFGDCGVGCVEFYLIKNHPCQDKCSETLSICFKTDSIRFEFYIQPDQEFRLCQFLELMSKMATFEQLDYLSSQSM